MKKVFLYKRWSYLIFLNNLMMSGFFVFSKFFFFLHFDVKKSSFWVYSVTLKNLGSKILNFKKKVLKLKEPKIL